MGGNGPKMVSIGGLSKADYSQTQDLLIPISNSCPHCYIQGLFSAHHKTWKQVLQKETRRHLALGQINLQVCLEKSRHIFVRHLQIHLRATSSLEMFPPVHLTDKVCHR